MKLLVIDTSTNRADVTLAYNGEFKTLLQEGVKEHAKSILPMIEQILAEANLSLTQLDGLIFGQGPGSFTGLRVACAVVKGLALATDLPVFSISNLQAIAYAARYQCNDFQKPILAVMDARMQEVYWAYYPQDKISGVSENLSSLANIRDAFAASTLLAGIGFEQYLMDESCQLKEKLSGTMEIYPTGYAMARLVLDGHCQPVDAAMAVPVYIRNNIIQV